MKNRLVPVKSWNPVFKRRNNATLKKGHSIQVNINPMLQKCEHSPVVVKKTQIVFCPGAEPTNPESVCVSLFYVIDTGSIRPRARILGGERVLFIGTQFSILYTSMYSPA